MSKDKKSRGWVIIGLITIFSIMFLTIRGETNKINDEIISEPIGGAHRDKDIILENVRNSIRNNLNFFVNMDKEQILLHRKNKFLSIGRGKGFASYTDKSESLLMKTTIIDNIKNKILQNKNYLIIALAIIAMIIAILKL